MKYSDKADLVAQLRASMEEKEKSPLMNGNEDGKFIDERIAFERWTPEEKALYQAQQDKLQKDIDEVRKKQAEEAKVKDLLRQALDERRGESGRARQWFTGKDKK